MGGKMWVQRFRGWRRSTQKLSNLYFVLELNWLDLFLDTSCVSVIQVLGKLQFLPHGNIDPMKGCTFLAKTMGWLVSTRTKKRGKANIPSSCQKRKKRTTYRGSHGGVKPPLYIGRESPFSSSRRMIVNGEGGRSGDAVEDQAGEYEEECGEEEDVAAAG